MSLLNTINWVKILEVDEFIFKDKSKKVKLERIKNALSELFFSRPNLDKNAKIETKFLFLKSMQRNDYNSLFDEIVSTCADHSKQVLNLQYIKSFRIRIYPIMIFFKYLFIYRKACRSSLLDSIFLILRMTSYLEFYDKTKHYRYKYLIVFADMQPIDNMLVQISKKKKITTITMQHGLYIDYKDYITVNAVNYLHTVADIFLAWGEDTAKIINKYHPEITAKIVGKPIEPQKFTPKQKYFTVVFDSNYFFNHNLELLKIAYEISDTVKLKVNLKLHPINKIEWFKIKDDLTLIDQDIMSSEFILGHTTTILYECMISGIPSFRYRTDKPSNKILNDLEFENTNECINILNNPKFMSLDYNTLSTYYFKYISTESKEQYRSFFNSLL